MSKLSYWAFHFISFSKLNIFQYLHFLPFPALGKWSPRIFWHFSHSGNRPHVFFAISHAREIVSKIFLAFPTLGKSSQKFFWHFPHSGNRLKKFFAISHTQEIVSKNFLPFPTLKIYFLNAVVQVNTRTIIIGFAYLASHSKIAGEQDYHFAKAKN